MFLSRNFITFFNYKISFTKKYHLILKMKYSCIMQKTCTMQKISKSFLLINIFLPNIILILGWCRICRWKDWLEFEDENLYNNSNEPSLPPRFKIRNGSIPCQSSGAELILSPGTLLSTGNVQAGYLRVYYLVQAGYFRVHYLLQAGYLRVYCLVLIYYL